MNQLGTEISGKDICEREIQSCSLTDSFKPIKADIKDGLVFYFYRSMLELLNFRLIESNHLITFGLGVKGIFSNFDPTNDTYAIAPFVNRMRSTYTDFCKAYERESVNPFTKQLESADELRDFSFLAFRSNLITCSLSEVAAEKEAAERLIQVLVKHGWGAQSFGYKSETAAITIMINEINDFYMADLTLLGATAFFNRMVTRENEFDNMQQSSVSRPPSGLPTVTEARPKLIEALRKLLNIVDYQLDEHPEDAILTGYMKGVNDLITLTMTTARAAQTRDENQTDTPSTPGTTV